MRRPPLDNFANLFDDFLRTGMTGIEHAATRCEFCLGHRRMPCLRGPQRPFAILWKSALENVDVDGRIIEQFCWSMLSAVKEV